MNTTLPHWHLFDSEAPVLTCEYSFGPGAAKALAVPGSAGLLVISPPCVNDDGVFDALAPHGAVQALIAPNAFHYLGLVAWHARYPQAPIFAPASAIPRLQRKTGLTGIRPLTEAATLTGPGVTLIDLPHCKQGETLVQVQCAQGRIWFLADLVLNMPTLPDGLIAKLVFKLSNSAPGLKFNALAGLLIVDDKAALKRWMRQQLAQQPPTWLIPSHGRDVHLGHDPAPLARLFAGA